MVWRKAARKVLHDLGGLAALRWLNRGKFQALMFHAFDEPNLPSLEALCLHISRNFNPVSLSEIAAAMQGGPILPDRAVTITVDDGYRSFWLHGWPIFRSFHIPVTIYVVSEFSDRRIWLWPDQIEYALQRTAIASLDVQLGDTLVRHLKLSSDSEKQESIALLTEALKYIPNVKREEFLNGLGSQCGVTMPATPPAGKAAMSWEELRTGRVEGLEVGCHTATHPILSQIQDGALLKYEIAGAKHNIEAKLGFPVVHFAYPNGQPHDINDSVVKCVREAGFATAVTTTWGLNSLDADSLRLRRTPFDSTVDLQYGVELLAGLHF